MRKLPHVTTRTSVEVRGVYGQSVLDLHEQIQRLLLQETKNKGISDFFAEPQINSLRGEITWYTQTDGPVIKFIDLLPPEKEDLWVKLQVVIDQIKVIGEKYAALGGQGTGTRIDTFRAMLSITSVDQCLFSVGGQPVLCEWGCNPIGESIKPVDLWTLGAYRDEQLHESETIPQPPNDLHRKSLLSHPHAQNYQSSTIEEQPFTSVESQQQDPVSVSKPQREPNIERPTRKTIPKEVTKNYAVNDNKEQGWRYSTKIGFKPYSRILEWLWNYIRIIILLCLGLLFFNYLLRGCTEVYYGAPYAHDTGQDEEAKLRADIADLRQKALDLAEKCSRDNTLETSGSTIIHR